MSNAFPTPSSAVPKSRGWLVFFGILSILVGIFAIAWPLAMTVVIEQVIGIVLVVSGVFAIGAVAFGEEKHHRVATVVLAVIRLVTGLLLLLFIKPGVVAITAVLGAFFFAEGAVCVVSAFTLRRNPAWLLILFNGLLAFVLGGMIFAQFPSSAAWAVGLLYGINSVFYGVSLLTFGLAHRNP
jgi:uncharacterized membrane protein HdeD (DUF308 family)